MLLHATCNFLNIMSRLSLTTMDCLIIQKYCMLVQSKTEICKIDGFDSGLSTYYYKNKIVNDVFMCTYVDVKQF